MRVISFRSPFPPEECARRLKAATEPDRGGLFEDLNRSHVVLARLRGQKVRLRVRRPFTRNALAPIFYGRYEAIRGGTLLRGRFRTHPAVVAFVVMWFTIFNIEGWIYLFSLRTLPAQDTWLQGGRLVVMMPPVLTGLSAALLWFLWRLGRADQNDILHLIRHALKATTDDAAA